MCTGDAPTVPPLRALVGAAAFVFVALLGCDTRKPEEGESTPPPVSRVSPADGVVVGDRDGDGIQGAADLCPDEPGLAADGCPLRDDDGDGILNPEDRCPDVCEVINGVRDDDGCPDANPGDDPEIAAILGPIQGLSFATRKATILPSSRPRLDAIAEVLLRHPEADIEVSGHTDDRDSDRISRLSITGQRAAAVVAYLVMKGVASDRLESRDFGPERPLASNKSAEGRAANRRVELSLRNPEPSLAPGCVRPPKVEHVGPTQ